MAAETQHEAHHFLGLQISPKQARTIARSTAHVNVWSGAIRSGKTFASSLRWLHFVAHAPQGGQLVMIGRTRDSLARNVIAPMQDASVFGEAIASSVHYNTSAPYATIMGKRVYVMGASDAKAEKSLRGLTLAGAYVDEVTVIAEDFFTQLLGRLNVPGAQLFITTNPDSKSHWFKKKFLDNIGPNADEGQLHNWKSWYFSLADNPALTTAYKRKISNEFTGLFYKRFILGEWVAAEGAVYDMFDENMHVIPHVALPRITKYYAVGIDYGTTNSTVAIAVGMGEDGRLYAVDEWRYTPTTKEVRKTDADLSAGITTWLREPNHDQNEYSETLEQVPVIVDPAAASFRVQMKKDGVRTVAANNDVLYGIRTISSLLSTGKLMISDHCPGLLEEITGYVWDSKASDDGVDAVIKKDDHSLDALRYGIVTTERRWRRDLNALDMQELR